MTLAAGRLNKRVLLQSPMVTQDSGMGAVETEWWDEAEVWAAIEPLSVKDFISAAANQSQVTARIVLRYRDDIRPDWRVSHGGRIYTISGILRDADSGTEYLTLAVSEGVNQAGP